MNKIACKSLNVMVCLALSLSITVAQAKHKKHPAPAATNALSTAPNAAKTTAPSTAKPALAKVTPNSQTSQPLPADQVDSSEMLKVINGKKHLTRKEKKEQKQQLHEDLDTTPILAEVLKLKWDAAPLQGPVKDVKKVDLDKVFHETVAHSIAVRQSQVQIKDAETLAKDTHDPIFNPLNPFEPGVMKQAAESNVDAARAHLETVRQQELLASAKAYSDLTQAFLGKYLAFQAIQQGRSQLQEEQTRFVSGETTRFDVTQTQMALLERYSKYLEADNNFHAASMLLADRIDSPPEVVLVPDGVELQEQNQAVPLLKLLPEHLELSDVLKSLKTRPDQREMLARQVALQKGIKASFGLDKQRHKAELHQLELEGDKLIEAERVTAEKAFADYGLAKKTLEMAQQRADMANHYLYQLQISHTAGFSSAKDVLDGQIELAKVKTALIGAEVAYNYSQIELLYEMGQLEEQVISRPPSGITNTL